MRSELKLTSIQELMKMFHTIEYPEFQRESTVWTLLQKRLLIDSILRDLDIGSLYLVAVEQKYYECVDGRQRLNAIFSFLGINEEDRKDNNFAFVPKNDVVPNDDRFEEVSDRPFGHADFKPYRQQFLEYKVRIVLLTDVSDDWELNLQFQRLQIAQILNGAEKLNAMVGDMRNIIFGIDGKPGLGCLDYFQKVGTRNSRYGGQQSASQTIINAASLAENGTFERARFVDMQIFFKNHFHVSPDVRKVVDEVRQCAEELCEWLSTRTLKIIRNRALVVSILLFRFQHQRSRTFEKHEWNQFDDFIEHVIERLREVSNKRINKRPTRWEQLQLAITQASVEKTAIEKRHELLGWQFRHYLRRQSHG